MMSEDVRPSGACDEHCCCTDTSSRTRDEHRLSGEDSKPFQASMSGHAGQADRSILS